MHVPVPPSPDLDPPVQAAEVRSADATAAPWFRNPEHARVLDTEQEGIDIAEKLRDESYEVMKAREEASRQANDLYARAEREAEQREQETKREASRKQSRNRRTRG